VDFWEYYKQYGVFGLSRKIIHRIIALFVDYSSNLLFEWDGTTLPQIETRCPLNIRTGSKDDIHRLAVFYNYSEDSPPLLKLKERLARGDRPYLAFSKETLVHISWLSRSSKLEMGEIWGYLSFKKDQAYIFHCHTKAGFRGENIFPVVLQQILNDMASGGVKQVFITCRKSNIASAKGIQKAGFSLKRKLCALRLFGKKVGPKIIAVD
jgi:RimJ/RimL family protein N-acetyltransferase